MYDLVLSILEEIYRLKELVKKQQPKYDRTHASTKLLSKIKYYLNTKIKKPSKKGFSELISDYCLYISLIHISIIHKKKTGNNRKHHKFKKKKGIVRN